MDGQTPHDGTGRSYENVSAQKRLKTKKTKSQKNWHI